MFERGGNYYCPKCGRKMEFREEDGISKLICECGEEVLDRCPRCGCLLESREKPGKLVLECVFEGCKSYKKVVWLTSWRGESDSNILEKYLEVVRRHELPVPRELISRELGRYPFSKLEENVKSLDLERLVDEIVWDEMLKYLDDFEELPQRKVDEIHEIRKRDVEGFVQDFLREEYGVERRKHSEIVLFYDSDDKLRNLSSRIREQWRNENKKLLETIERRIGFPVGQRGINSLVRATGMREDKVILKIKELEIMGLIEPKDTVQGKIWAVTERGLKYIGGS